MSTSTFRPQVEQLDGRCLPSANPAITISDPYVTEGNSGQTAIVFHVTLSKASSRQVSVDFATADGGARVGDDRRDGAVFQGFDLQPAGRTGDTGDRWAGLQGRE